MIRKVKSPFKVKSINPHTFCVMCRVKWSYREEYVEENERNVEKRWSVHNNPTEKTELARHFFSSISHLFAWENLMFLSKNKRTCKNLKGFFIAVQKPLLNEQVKSNLLHLFSKQHHMREVFNNFNDFLLYFLLIL